MNLIHIPYLTLSPLTWKIWQAPNIVSKWQMGFNSAFKELISVVGFIYFMMIFYLIVLTFY